MYSVRVLGKLVWTNNNRDTYIDEHESWSGILVMLAFTMIYTTNILKDYSTRQFIFSHDMIILITPMADWELIRQRKQVNFYKENIR